MKTIPRSLLAGIPDFDVLASAHAHNMRAWRAHMARVKADEVADPPIPPRERHAAYPQPSAHPLVAAAVDENDEVAFEIIEDGPTPQQVLAARKAQLLREVSAAEHAAKSAVAPIGKLRLFAMREDDIRRAEAEQAKRLAAEHSSAVEALMADHAAALDSYVSGISEEQARHAERVAAARDKIAATPAPGMLSRTAVALGLKDPPDPVPLPVLAPPPPPPVPPSLPPPPDIAGLVAEARSSEDASHLEDQQRRRGRIAAIERAAAQAHHDIEDLTVETVDFWPMPDFSV